MYDTKRLLEVNAARGFPGMLGSIDCYNWTWKNCPSGKEGQYKGNKAKSVVLEAVASHDLWIWHCFFGCPGSLNDINVLQRSPLMDAMENGTMHRVEFELNGKPYTLPYWLADGIYPNYPVFAKSIKDPITAAKKFYAKMQESIRKDIERAFGVLQARFAIVKIAARQWKKSSMSMIMKCCIILHNMIVEDERDDEALLNNLKFDARFETSQAKQAKDVQNTPFVEATNASLIDGSIGARLKRMNIIRRRQSHDTLQQDLIEHLWKLKMDQ